MDLVAVDLHIRVYFGGVGLGGSCVLLLDQSFALLIFDFDEGKLLIQVSLEMVLDPGDARTDFLECRLFLLDAVRIFTELPLQVQRVLQSLFRNHLLKLVEHGGKFVVQGFFVKAEVFVVQNETFVLLLNFLEEVLAESLDLLVEVHHLLSLAQFAFLSRAGGNFQPRKEIFDREWLAHGRHFGVLAVIPVSLVLLRITLFAPRLRLVVKQNHLPLVLGALIGEGGLRHQLRRVLVEPSRLGCKGHPRGAGKRRHKGLGHHSRELLSLVHKGVIHIIIIMFETLTFNRLNYWQLSFNLVLFAVTFV